MSRSTPHRHAEFGVASTCIGCAMLAIQLGVLSAVLLGKDNQGIIYAVTIPFAMYCIGVPLGLVTAAIGLAQPRRDRRFAKLGIALTLAGPFLFGCFVLVRIIIAF